MPPNVARGLVCAAAFIFIMKAMACIMGYHSDQPSNTKISSSTSHSHKSIKTYHLSFQNCLFLHRDLSHWIGQDKTVLNWNGSVQTTQRCYTVSKANRLQANSPQLPNSNVESVNCNPIFLQQTKLNLVKKIQNLVKNRQRLTSTSFIFLSQCQVNDQAQPTI